jgi:hypothetical protein
VPCARNSESNNITLISAKGASMDESRGQRTEVRFDGAPPA